MSRYAKYLQERLRRAMSSIKGIIFDYGGTIDTDGIHWGEFIWSEYRRAGINITREEYREAYVYAERYLAKNPVIEPTDTFKRLLEKKIAIQFDKLRQTVTGAEFAPENEKMIAEGCYSRVKETLKKTCAIVEELSKTFPIVLVTNFYGNMPVVLKEFGLSAYFRTIVESSAVGLRKPDPALFSLGVEALGMRAEDIAVVGDSYRKDIYPSSTLGCSTVWLKNICWEEEPVIEGHGPTTTIKSLEELPQAIDAIAKGL